jgi:EAL domain-containing protein (putative c-di-GMP-specific phosphodiesterase class I)
VRGCHCFQGYWVSKPLPAQEFIEFVGKRPK